MNFDWTKPVVIDWSGRSGPLITEHDVKNSVIKRILHNQYCAPFCEKPNIRVKPWWNPQDPLAAKAGTNTPLWKNDRFIPGLHLVCHPQVSTLSKTQHLQGLRVLNAKAGNVQPKCYSRPCQSDYTAFEEMEELYKAEQIEFLKWAKLKWINGDCIRALRPKPILEKVYEAEFKMRLHEIQSLPSNYALAAQIPLETKNDFFELEHKEDLINVDVQDLPVIDYPEQMEKAFTILMKSCPVPEPCPEHPCKFVLPHEDTVSVLPLSEIHRELALYAIENGSKFVASESALRCLLQTDQSWKVPVSVVEVICPEYGDLKTVVVLGSEFDIQKECSKQRTYKAYKHLLRHTFAPSTGHYRPKTSTKETTDTINTSPGKTLDSTVTKEQVSPRLNRFVSLDDDLEVSSDENSGDKLLIDDNESNNEPIQSKDRCKSDRLIHEHTKHDSDRKMYKSDLEPSNANRLMTDIGNYGLDFYVPEESNDAYNLIPSYSHYGPTKAITEPIDFYEPNYKIDANKDRPSYSHDRDESGSEPDRLFIEDNSKADEEPSCSKDYYKPDYSNNSRPSYSHNRDETDNEPGRLFIKDTSKTDQEPSCSKDFYKPDYSNNSRPSYSHNRDETDSDPDQLFIKDASKSDKGPSCSKDVYKPDYSNNSRPSYSHNRDESDIDPDQLFIKDASKSDEGPGCSKDIYKPDYSNNSRPSYSHNRDETDNEPGRLFIKDTSKTNQEPSCSKDFYKPDYSNNSRPSYSHNRDEADRDPDQLFIKDASKCDEGPGCSKDVYKPDYSNNSRPSYSHNRDEPGNEPDRLFIKVSSNADEETGCSKDFYKPDYSNNPRPSYSNDKTSSPSDRLFIKISPEPGDNYLCEPISRPSLDSPDQLVVNEDDESNHEPDFNQDFCEPNYNDTSNSCDSEPDNFNNEPISNVGNPVSRKPFLRLFDSDEDTIESNLDSIPSLLKINEDAPDSNIDATPSVFETNKDNSEPSEDLSSRSLEIDKDTSGSNVDAAMKSLETKKYIAESNVDSFLSLPMTSEDSSESNIDAPSSESTVGATSNLFETNKNPAQSLLATNENSSDSNIDTAPNIAETNEGRSSVSNVGAASSVFKTSENIFGMNEDSTQSLFETNENSSESNKDTALNIAETNEDRSESNVGAASSVFKASENIFEINENATQSLFETNENSSESNIDTASNIAETNEDRSETNVGAPSSVFKTSENIFELNEDSAQSLFETNKESNIDMAPNIAENNEDRSESNVGAPSSVFKTSENIFEMNEDFTQSLFETNENSSASNIEFAPNMIKTNEDSSELNEGAASSLFEANENTFEMNEDATQSLFETNENSSESNIDMAPNKIETNKDNSEASIDSTRSLLEINEDNSESNVGAATSLFETNENTSESNIDTPPNIMETNDDDSESSVDLTTNFLEINEDTSESIVSAASSLLKANENIFVMNEDATQSLFEINENSSESKIDIAAKMISEDNSQSTVDLTPSFLEINDDTSESKLNAAPNFIEIKEDISESNEDSVSTLVKTSEEHSESSIDAAPSSESNNDSTQSSLEINKDNSETKVDAAPSLFETNEDAVPRLLEINENFSESNIEAALSILETNENNSESTEGAASSLFDTNENTSESYVEAGPSLLKNNKHTMKFNVNAIPSLFETIEDNSETNLDTDKGSFVKKKDAVTSLCMIDLDASDTNVKAAGRSVENLGTKIKLTHTKICTNESTTTSDGSNNQTDLSKTNKPPKISVRKLSLFETKEYIFTDLSANNPIKKSYCETNSDVSGVNTPSTEISKAPPRLGISGIITRNRTSLTSNISGNNKPTTTTTEVLSSKPARRRSVRISNAKERETEVMEVSEIITKKASVINVENEVDALHTNMIQLSPVKPCSVSVEKIDLEPYSKAKPSASETKTHVSGETNKKTIDIPKPITRKRSISNVNTEVAKVVKSTRKGIDVGLEPNIREPSVSGTTEEAETSITNSSLKPRNENLSDPSPPKSARKLSFNAPLNNSDPQHNIGSIESEASCSQTKDNDLNEPSNKRIRKLSEQIFREHDFCHFRAEDPRTALPEPRKVNISKLKHDHANSSNSTISFEKSSSEHSNRDTGPISITIDDIVSIPDTIKLNLNLPIAVETKNPSYNEPKPDIENVASTNPTSMPFKTIPRKISELFGDESESDESIYNTSYGKNSKKVRTAFVHKIFGDNRPTEPSCKILESQTNTEPITKPDARKLSNKGVSIEKSTLKPCLRKSDSEFPRSSKRKLSFSDPLTSDTELNVSVSEADNEEPIAGFHNGVAIPSTRIPKNPKKQKNTVTCTYGLRSRNKPKMKVAKKSKTSNNNKEKSCFTKVTPPLTRYNTRNAQKRISCSDSDNVEKKQNNTENVALRKSKSIPARVYKESDEAKTKKTNVNNTPGNSEGPRRSRRISDRSSTTENMQTKTNSCLCTTSSFTKINKTDRNRRKSLPANIFSEAVKTNRVPRSKSFTNLTEFSKTTSRYNTRSQNKDTSNSLKLSERTKRYLRRVFSFESSETDESDEEMADRTQRNIRRSKFSTFSGTEQSDADIKNRTKRYTRSSAPNVRQTNNSKTRASTINNENESERTKSQNLRSTAAANSSSDETTQPNLIRRKKTKRQPRENNTIDSSTNQKEANEEQLINIEPKKEVMNIETKIDKLEYEFNFDTIKIDITEEMYKIICKTEMNVLHFTELRVNQMDMCDDNSSCTDDQNSLDSTNHLQDMIRTKEESNLQTNEMDVSDSDADNNKNTPNEPITEDQLNELDQTKLDIDATCTTINEVKSKENAISEDSNSSDYFDMEETEVLNMFHFTATNDTDSDDSEQEDFLIVDDSQTETVQVNTVVEADNQTEEQYPNQESLCEETVDTDEFKKQHFNPIYGSFDTSNINEPGPSHAKVETKIDFSKELTLNKTDNTKELYIDKSLTEDLSQRNEMLYTSALTKENINEIIGVYNCTCKGTLFEVPPPRSFKKWRVRSKNSNLGFNMIVHSSHKAKKDDTEMLLEPIVEYQPELGGCKQSAGRIRALALSLMLRQTAGLINVRVDHENGDVIVIDKMTHENFIVKYGDKRDEVSNILHTTLNQLRFLMPGQYVLAHDASHGNNAMLYTTKGAHSSKGELTLNLHPDNINMSDADDAIFAKVPPDLDSVLMPFHKFKSVLPLAFTPYKTYVKENKKMAAALAKAKLPPQAIQWPKKKKKKSKKLRGPRNRQVPSVPLEE